MQHSSPAMNPPPAEEGSDAALALRAASGDEAAFEHIMRRHNRLLFRTARSILHSDAEAEDALQDAYLRAWRALCGFRTTGPTGLPCAPSCAPGWRHASTRCPTRFGLCSCCAPSRNGASRRSLRALADAFSFDGARCNRIVAGVMARLHLQTPGG